MLIHFDDLDGCSQVKGLRSSLIIPCNISLAVTVAEREE